MKQTLNKMPFQGFYVKKLWNQKPWLQRKLSFPTGPPPKPGEAGLGIGLVTSRPSPFLALFVEIDRRVPISAYLEEGFLCREHLSTSIWPGPKSISWETPNSCQMVLTLGEYQMNTILTATGKEGPQLLLSKPETPSLQALACLLAHSLTPNEQLPYFLN